MFGTLFGTLFTASRSSTFLLLLLCCPWRELHRIIPSLFFIRFGAHFLGIHLEFNTALVLLTLVGRFSCTAPVLGVIGIRLCRVHIGYQQLLQHGHKFGLIHIFQTWRSLFLLITSYGDSFHISNGGHMIQNIFGLFLLHFGHCITGSNCRCSNGIITLASVFVIGSVGAFRGSTASTTTRPRRALVIIIIAARRTRRFRVLGAPGVPWFLLAALDNGLRLNRGSFAVIIVVVTRRSPNRTLASHRNTDIFQRWDTTIIIGFNGRRRRWITITHDEVHVRLLLGR